MKKGLLTGAVLMLVFAGLSAQAVKDRNVDPKTAT